MKPISGKASLSVLLGAAFLMATSSIGPGFMLQTAAFTNDLKADFAFAIIVSVIFSIIAQLNVWTIIGISKMRGQDIANKVSIYDDTISIFKLYSTNYFYAI